MEMHRFTLEPFDSQETGASLQRQVRRRQEVRKRTRMPASVYRQTALCALIVALLIVLELFVFRAQTDAIPASVPAENVSGTLAADNGGEEEDEESLGRLQFVSGRVYSVFSSNASWALPFAPTETEALEDGALLCLKADAGTPARAAAAGLVQSVAEDSQYGTIVRIFHGDDRESVYYGLGSVSVEAGQPLLAGDTIGYVGDNGMLYLAALQQGERMPVLDCFAVEPLTVT